MKKITLSLVVLALLLGSTAAKQVRLVRLTLVNRSGMDIEVSLTGQEYEEFYYLKVAEGDRLVATETTFTVMPDTYAVDAYFVELWDPVYGAQCDDRTDTVDIMHNTRIIIFECNASIPNAGEAPLIKLGGVNTRAGGGVRGRR